MNEGLTSARPQGKSSLLHHRATLPGVMKSCRRLKRYIDNHPLREMNGWDVIPDRWFFTSFASSAGLDRKSEGLTHSGPQ